MWSQATRKVLISSVYEYLFWQKLDSSKQLTIDWDLLIQECYNEGQILTPEEFQVQFNIFLDNSVSYLSQVDEYFSDSSKTFDLVRSVLVIFIIEVNFIEPKPEKSLISKYIRITQDLVGGENPGLVHAIASKIYDKE